MKTGIFKMCKIQGFIAGIRHPQETKFDNHLQDLMLSNYTLNIPLIPTTPEEMEDMFRLCSHVRFKIPQQVWTALDNQNAQTTVGFCCVAGVAYSYHTDLKPLLFLFRFYRGLWTCGSLTTRFTKKVGWVGRTALRMSENGNVQREWRNSPFSHFVEQYSWRFLMRAHGTPYKSTCIWSRHPCKWYGENRIR